MDNNWASQIEITIREAVAEQKREHAALMWKLDELIDAVKASRISATKEAER